MDIMEQGQVVLLNENKCAKILCDGGVVSKLLVNGKEIFTRKLFFIKEGILPSIGKYYLSVTRRVRMLSDKDYHAYSADYNRVSFSIKYDSSMAIKDVTWLIIEIPANEEIVDMRQFANNNSLKELEKYSYVTPNIVKSFFSGKSKSVCCYLKNVFFTYSSSVTCTVHTVRITYTTKSGKKVTKKTRIQMTSIAKDYVIEDICNIGDEDADIDIGRGLLFAFLGDVSNKTDSIRMNVMFESFYLYYKEGTT